MINRPLPEPNIKIVGYAALIQKYELKVPSPITLAAVSKKHKKYETDCWQIFTQRHTPKGEPYMATLFLHCAMKALI